MKILLDTHVWLWSLSEPHRLSASTRDLLIDPKNELLLSAASAWEIAIKFALGRLPLPEPPTKFVPNRMAAQRIAPLPVTHAHALAVAELPPHHADPFDRMLIAQAQSEHCPLMSADRRLQPYAIKFLWAD